MAPKVCRSFGGTGYSGGGEVDEDGAGDDEAMRDIHEERERDDSDLPPETDDATEELERKKMMQARAMGARQKKSFADMIRLRRKS